ncbi:MAG TPA: glycosyltransferase [Opitutaceae bacterium]|nr:glycosyltransferase [Opitutaceae bacterium]
MTAEARSGRGNEAGFPRRWGKFAQAACWGLGLLGLAAGAYLTLRKSSNLATVWWIPRPISRWTDPHGELRNLPAYFLLACPYLAVLGGPRSRVAAVVSLGVFGTALECLQLFIPTRWFDLVDIALTWAGLILAWFLFESVRGLLSGRWGFPSMPHAFGLLRPAGGSLRRGPVPAEMEETPGPAGSAAGRLRLLLVVEPGLDGVFRHVEGLVAVLLDRPIELHLAFSSRRCGRGMRRVVEQVRSAGGEIIDLKVSNLPTPLDLAALIRLFVFIKRIQPDIVHSHSSKAGLLGRAAAILGGCKRSFYSPHAYYGMNKPPWLKVRFFNQVESIFGRFGKTVVISSDEARFARENLGISDARIAVIPNPVDATRFRPATAEQRRAARAKFGIPEGATVLGMVGRMCWQKDPETAYAGVAPVCAENPDLLFLHLGWGKWKEYLLGLGHRLGLGSRLRILDYNEDPCSFYHAVDGLVMSSRYEAGWSLVFLEALACNLPVISSTCIGMSDIGQAGLSHLWTFQPEDRPGCSQAVRKWLAGHRRDSGRPACNHRDYVIEHFSPERGYGAIYDLYRAVPSPKKSRSQSENRPAPSQSEGATLGRWARRPPTL